MTGNSEPRTAAYGTWESPISAADVASAGVEFDHLAVDGGDVYWRERRPDEDGRGVVLRHDGASAEEVVPEGFDVRTLVHEYGGGDFAVRDGVVFLARFDDQRVYRVSPDADPVAVTPEPATERGLRYADFEIAPGGSHLYCVREDHDAVAGTAESAEGVDDEGDIGGTVEGNVDGGEPSEDDGNAGGHGDADEPVTTLVRLPADGEESPTVVAAGHDFYAAPRLSPAGDRLAWLTWDHPRMPWDGTELHVADVAGDGSLSDERVLMGGPGESVFGPSWGPDGRLHAVSDRTGWWNLYRREDGEWLPYREEAAEYGVPQWQFGLSTYAFLEDGRVAAVVTRDGRQGVELLDADGNRERANLPYESYSHPRLRSTGDALVVAASGPETPSSVVRWTPGEDPIVVRRADGADVDGGYLSTPEHVTYPTRDGAQAHAFVYPPANPEFEAPAGERPPLVVIAHGGPTSATTPSFDLDIQFLTSRGFAVADVNYRGSTGYGRAYREALDGEWGVRDVADCVDAAEYLADSGRVDPERTAVRGGSAGGFVVLSALCFHGEFAAGVSYYGVADLERLAALTHKFESRYLEGLVGPYPEAEGTYRARSPANHAGDIDVPVLLLQGDEDPVVPLSQAETMADALAANGVAHELLVFEGEQHGFRRTDSRRRAGEAELAFYGAVFGFDPADDLPDVDLSV